MDKNIWKWKVKVFFSELIKNVIIAAFGLFIMFLLFFIGGAAIKLLLLLLGV